MIREGKLTQMCFKIYILRVFFTEGGVFSEYWTSSNGILFIDQFSLWTCVYIVTMVDDDYSVYSEMKRFRILMNCWTFSNGRMGK